MSLIDKLEKKFGGLGIPNLTLILILGRVTLYISEMAGYTKFEDSYLVGDFVLKGELWRVLTFLFLPSSRSLLFEFIALYFLYFIGTSLEGTFGVFKYNLYLFISYIATVLVSFIFPFTAISSSMILLTLFFAFAYLYPDFEVLIFFILPVKVKWLALISVLPYLFLFLVSDTPQKCVILASFSNFVFFFARDIYQSLRYREKKFKKSIKKAEPALVKKCYVCGIDEVSHPDEDFRFCPKCSGQKCYCKNHIFSHEHK